MSEVDAGKTPALRPGCLALNDSSIFLDREGGSLAKSFSIVDWKYSFLDFIANCQKSSKNDHKFLSSFLSRIVTFLGVTSSSENSSPQPVSRLNDLLSLSFTATLDGACIEVFSKGFRFQLILSSSFILLLSSCIAVMPVVVSQEAHHRMNLANLKATTEYQEARQAKEEVESPAIGFAKTSDYKGGMEKAPENDRENQNPNWLGQVRGRVGGFGYGFG
uniref:Uncharacterized protein n=1 Tax=Tanacetum cinerariifolium TaxID=118510 RepID=A0A699HRQ2_TANCI|nr:hypothetical protein [Tanacetum cinerariifolium]